MNQGGRNKIGIYQSQDKNFQNIKINSQNIFIIASLP